MSEERIATIAGEFEILRAQRTTDAFLGEGSRVHRVVQEPRPVVIPQVVIGIVRADADSGEVFDGRHDA